MNTTNQITIPEFIEREKITITSNWTDDNPNMPAGSTHWQCTLRRKGKRLTIPFSMGPAYEGEPDAPTVLNCLASDTGGTDQAFESWARDLGYAEDSRKAEKIYKICQSQAKKLKKFLGDALYNELLYEVKPY